MSSGAWGWGNQRGALLLSALVLLVVGSAMIAAMTRMTSTQAVTSVDTYAGTQAIYLAESGLQIAPYHIQDQSCSCTATSCDQSETTVGNGTVAYTVMPYTSDASLATNEYRITATGAVPNQTSATGKRTLVQVIKIICGGANLWSDGNGVYACEEVKVTGSSTITSNIAGEEVDITGSATVNGTTSTPSGACDPLGIDSYMASNKPSGTPKSCELSGSSSKSFSPSGNCSNTSGGTYYYNQFKMSGSGDLTFDGSPSGKTFVIYVDGDFEKSGSGKIKLTNGAKVVLYVTGEFKNSGSGSIQVDTSDGQNHAEDFTVYSNTDDEIKFEGSGGFEGSVYAPNAEIKISGSGDVVGGVRGQEVKVEGSADFTFDTSLDSSTSSSSMVPGAWKESF